MFASARQSPSDADASRRCRATSMPHVTTRDHMRACPGFVRISDARPKSGQKPDIAGFVHLWRTSPNSCAARANRYAEHPHPHIYSSTRLVLGDEVTLRTGRAHCETEN